MNSVKFNTNSWHAFVVDCFTPWKLEKVTICQYIRRVIFGIIMMLLYAWLALFLASIVIGGTAYDVLWLLGKVHFHDKSQSYFEMCGMIWTVVLGAATLIGSLLLIFEYLPMKYREWRRKRDQNRMWNSWETKEPGVFKTAYQSWKEKFCFFVEFEKKE